MTLYEICQKIAAIQEGMLMGEISYTDSKLALAMKMGHPADILDEIISDVGWAVLEGKTPEIKTVVETTERLESFAEEFEVEELWDAIDDLKNYISTQSSENK